MIDWLIDSGTRWKARWMLTQRRCSPILIPRRTVRDPAGIELSRNFRWSPTSQRYCCVHCMYIVHWRWQRLWSVWSNYFSKCIVSTRYAVAEWYGAGLAIARSRVRIPPTAAVYQRQLSVPGSVNEYQRKLGSKRAYHVISVTLQLRTRLSFCRNPLDSSNSTALTTNCVNPHDTFPWVKWCILNWVMKERSRWWLVNYTT